MSTFKEAKEDVEKGGEALKCLEEKEFDSTEFWFDDILSDDEDLSDHLRLQYKEDCRDVHEPLHSYKDYMTDCEKGTVCLIFFKTLNQFSKISLVGKKSKMKMLIFLFTAKLQQHIQASYNSPQQR
jgi:hypothetical protein